MTRINQKPMREEEKNYLTRLQHQYDLKTRELAVIGREFLEYRSGLAARDDEFSMRFGKNYAVGEMKDEINSKMSYSLRLNPLPPLRAPHQK